MRDPSHSLRSPAPSQPYQTSFVVYEAPEALPEAERPQARLLRDGPAVCSTVELLQVVIGGDMNTSERAARCLLDRCRDLRGIANCSTRELAGLVYGVGDTKAAQLKASLELGKRLMTQPSDPRPMIKTPADAAELLMPEMGTLDQEEVRVMLIDARNRVIAITMVYRGSLNAASMRVGEVFKEAIRCSAASVVIAHNHPSTDPTPSAEDVVATKSLVAAGKLLDIEVLDHIVVAHTRFVSLKERGLGFDD